MIGDREALAAAARALVGTPFRLHGRSKIGGVDCVGLVETALRQIGRRPVALPHYGLRNACYGFVPALAELNGFRAVQCPIIRGDLVTVHPGPAQLHILIATATDHYVHAHAGLRRVTEMPGPLPWPRIHHFRLEEED